MDVSIEFTPAYVQPKYEVSRDANFWNILMFDEFKLLFQTDNATYELSIIVPELVNALDEILVLLGTHVDVKTKIVLRDSANNFDLDISAKGVRIGTFVDGSRTNEVLKFNREELLKFSDAVLEAYLSAIFDQIVDAAELSSVHSRISDYREHRKVL